MRKGGSDSLVIGLAIIIAIIIWAGIIILIILAVIGIGAGIVAIIKHYQEKKRIALEAKEKYEKDIQTLENELAECTKKIGSDPTSIFIESYSEILPLKIELGKGEYLAKYQKMSSIQKEDILNQIESNKQFINNHKKEVELTLPLEMHNAFIDLCCAIQKIKSSCQIWKVDKRNTKQYLYYWGSSMNRSKIEFKQEYFNDVIPTNFKDIYSIKIGSLKYYFYPEYIIEENSPISYNTYSYSKVSAIIKEVTVVEDRGQVKGATNIGYTYLHTRVDGGPDLRYSYNPRYLRNKYGYLVLSPISNFSIDIANWNEACQLHKCLNKMKDASKNYIPKGIPSYSDKNDNKSIKVENIINQDVYKIFQTIINQEGIQIIAQKSFISILDDYHAFNQKVYLKNILKVLQSEGYFETICKMKIDDKESSVFANEVSQKYFFKEEYVRELFYYLFRPINQ